MNTRESLELARDEMSGNVSREEARIEGLNR